jgi:hypothetical protein
MARKADDRRETSAKLNFMRIAKYALLNHNMEKSINKKNLYNTEV